MVPKRVQPGDEDPYEQFVSEARFNMKEDLQLAADVETMEQMTR